MVEARRLPPDGLPQLQEFAAEQFEKIKVHFQKTKSASEGYIYTNLLTVNQFIDLFFISQQYTIPSLGF